MTVLGLEDTEFPMVKVPTEAKTFLLSVFVIFSMALPILRWEVKPRRLHDIQIKTG